MTTCLQRPLKVLIVNSRPIYADGLQQVIEGGPLPVCGEVVLDPALAAGAPDSAPDLVLAAPQDWRELDDWISPLRKRLSRVPWLLLAELRVVGMFMPRLEAQPCVIVHSKAAAEELFAGMRAAARHHYEHLPTALMSRFMRSLRGRRGMPMTSRMPSVIELAIGCGVSLNLSNREIAGALQLSEATIKTHLHRLTSRMDLENRTELGDLINDALAYQPPEPEQEAEGRAHTL